MTITVILFGGLIVFLFLGFPIAIAIGLITMIGFVYSGVPLMQMVQRMFASVNSFTILAIPFFMLAGSLMETGGMSKRLVLCKLALSAGFSADLRTYRFWRHAFLPPFPAPRRRPPRRLARR
jgi:C4-dicarboxylate transporter DctM subunit